MLAFSDAFLPRLLARLFVCPACMQAISGALVFVLAAAAMRVAASQTAKPGAPWQMGRGKCKRAARQE
ncbi:hypothetical protein GQ54DRAFT_297505 [Martensiomyces pterosporus]|nr:hypothetical protein GQ54DRAFT_297505 [Martensiomyces pterosporus]